MVEPPKNWEICFFESFSLITEKKCVLILLWLISVCRGFEQDRRTSLANKYVGRRQSRNGPTSGHFRSEILGQTRSERTLGYQIHTETCRRNGNTGQIPETGHITASSSLQSRLDWCYCQRDARQPFTRFRNWLLPCGYHFLRRPGALIDCTT